MKTTKREVYKNIYFLPSSTSLNSKNICKTHHCVAIKKLACWKWVHSMTFLQFQYRLAAVMKYSTRGNVKKKKQQAQDIRSQILIWPNTKCAVFSPFLLRFIAIQMCAVQLLYPHSPHTNDSIHICSVQFISIK